MIGMQRIRDWIDSLEGGSDEADTMAWHTLAAGYLIRLYRFVQITIREFLDDRLLLRAMALTFATLLSIIPLLAILFGMFQMFGGGEWFVDVLRPVLMRNLAPGSGPAVAQRIEELLVARGGGPAVSGIGLLFLVFAVYGIFTGIESTFNLIWGVSLRAGVLHRLPLYWGLVTIIPILVVSSLALTTYIKALPLVHQAVESVSFADSLINRLLPVLMVMLGFFLLYRFLPNTRVRTYAALLGAVIAGLIYELLKSGFIFYTGKLVQYDVIYGSLAIIPLLMVWVNLSWVVVLLGVEICFVTQHYDLLQNKRKHVVFSRPQKDALAYLI
ncbi:MAG TPA: YihY family inner membrane protein, partial [Bacteroidetes bacterium]|nr:YihY family inner membrane protein [Bacteroidota bacterium]